MAQFHIKKYDYTTQVDDFDALLTMAKSGSLEPSDLIKPQGSSEWLYAGELHTIQDLVSESTYGEPPSKIPTMIGIVFLIGTLLCGYLAWQNQQTIPSESDLQIVGQNGLNEDDALITVLSKMYGDPQGRNTIATLEKNTVLRLIEKKDSMFKVEYNNKEGWIGLDKLAPMYLFAGEKIRKEYQARFDPHRFINLLNPSWDRPEYGSDKTNISFQLQNLSPYPVQDIVVTVSIKDTNGTVKHREDFEISGTILEGDTSRVYTVNPPPRSDDQPILVTRSALEKMEKADRSVGERVLDSIERSFDKGSVGPISMRVTKANSILPKK